MNSIKGTVFSGMEKAAEYLSLQPYKDKIEEKTGFRPFEGTLNLRVNPEEVRKLKENQDPEVVESFDYRGENYSRLEIYEVRIEGEKATFIDIEITDYEDDVMEIIAPEKLRDSLELEDGDEVEVTY